VLTVHLLGTVAPQEQQSSALADEALKPDQAEALWSQAKSACKSAELDPPKEYRFHLGASRVGMEDSWPTVVKGMYDHPHPAPPVAQWIKEALPALGSGHVRPQQESLIEQHASRGLGRRDRICPVTGRSMWVPVAIGSQASPRPRP